MRLHWLIASALALIVLSPQTFAQDTKRYTYLALGDSVAFGFDPTLFSAAGPLPTPDQFTGYPETVARVKRQDSHVNAACPGETSASFIVAGAPDNGCYGEGPEGQPSFKTTIGLHTNYKVSQLEFARRQLRTNKDINLVTLSLGGNELSLLQANCAKEPDFAECVTKALPGVLGNYANNLGFILSDLRQQGGYQGKLTLVTYYSPNASPLVTGAIAALNQTMTQVGSQFGVKVADGFLAFQLVSSLFGGDPCAAGLLIRLPAPGPNGACDIHPSPRGRDLLAAAVLLASEK
jgi:lysophospholipase L1-like esterase